MEGRPAADSCRAVREEDGAVLEPTTVDLVGDERTLNFPSGNRMTFRRRP